MRYELFVGLRYLRAKRKEAFISLITLIAMAGVMIGVMTLNVVLAVMTGFEEDLRDRILGFNPHVIVVSFEGPLSGYDEVLEKVRGVPGVVAAAPFVYGQVMVSHGEAVTGAVVRGIRVGEEAVVDVKKLLRQGSLEGLETRKEPPELLLGGELARQLGATPGDEVQVISPLGTPSAVGFLPRSRRFRVGGVFESGMSEYDAALVYMRLEEAQSFFELGDAVTGVEVRVERIERADRVARAIEGVLGFPYRVRSWMDINHNLFSALKLEKTVYFIVLLLIVLVAAFNIVATLIMVVMEKKKDIAILKSMGATAAGVGRIFVFKGLVIGVVGTLLGNVAGYVACWALRRYEFIELPKDVFYVSTLPVKIYPEYFLLVTAASLFICLLATLYPARQAARLLPVDVIRYE
ncbi:MAG: ABC transporter permease [Candidatus Binatia bacterium]|nr:MAG: ABC transporter permease [Candidatus Binatia bacterium]